MQPFLLDGVVDTTVSSGISSFPFFFAVLIGSDVFQL